MNKTFTSPVDASNYFAGLGMVPGFKLLSINYEENRYRFNLLDEDENVLAGGAVFGVNVDEAKESDARADIRAAIYETSP